MEDFLGSPWQVHSLATFLSFLPDKEGDQRKRRKQKSELFEVQNGQNLGITSLRGILSLEPSSWLGLQFLFSKLWKGRQFTLRIKLLFLVYSTMY